MTRFRAVIRVLASSFALLAAAQFADAQDVPRPPRSYQVNADGTVTVRGRVVVSDLNKDRHERAQGRGAAVLWYGIEGREGHVGSASELDIVDGAWTATFAPAPGGSGLPVRISLRSCLIDGVDVAVDGKDFVLEEAGEILFAVHAIPELRLRVVDADSRQALHAVEVFLEHGWPQQSTLHPGTAELRRLVDGESPLVVPAPGEVSKNQSSRLWVRAPKHSWQSIDVYFAEGGTRDVVLSRGGMLATAMHGEPPADTSRLALRIYGMEGEPSPLAEFAPMERGLGEIDGLAAGRYEVRIEQGDWFRQPGILARAVVDVDAGARVEVELTIKATGATRPRVSLRGVLAMPTAWETTKDQISMELDPLQGAQRHAGTRRLHGSDLVAGERDGEYRFHFSDVVAGRYAIKVLPSQHQRLLTVAGDEKDEVRIEVPEPVDVVVRIVDADTGAPRKGLSLSWHPPPPMGVMSWTSENASAPANSNELRFRAPVGWIRVESHGGDYEVAERTLRVGREDREFELEALPVYGVRIVIHEGNTILPTGLGTGWDIQLRGLAGERLPMGWRDTGVLTVKNAGIYLLSVEAPAGYHPVPDRQVKVTTAPFPTIEFVVAQK